MFTYHLITSERHPKLTAQRRPIGVRTPAPRAHKAEPSPSRVPRLLRQAGRDDDEEEEARTDGPAQVADDRRPAAAKSGKGEEGHVQRVGGMGDGEEGTAGGGGEEYGRVLHLPG